VDPRRHHPPQEHRAEVGDAPAGRSGVNSIKLFMVVMFKISCSVLSLAGLSSRV
jgi:hypothetical protein